jgi:type IV secretion system protein VirD4
MSNSTENQTQRLLLGYLQPATGRQLGFHAGPARTVADQPLWHDGHSHLMTIARTGSGKGTGACIPAALLHPGGLISMDPTGVQAAITARARRLLGQQVIVLDPAQITGLPGHSLNPLDLIDLEHHAVEDVQTLVHSLAAPLLADTRNAFWVLRAMQLVIALTLMLLHEAAMRPGSAPASLPRVRELVHGCMGSLEAILRRMAACPHPEVRAAVALLQNDAKETLGGILSFAQELVDFVRGAGIEASVSSSSFDANVLTTDPSAVSVYLVLPPHMLESHGRVLALWLSALYLAITRRRVMPQVPTLLLLDEAAQLGTLPALRQAVTLLRNYGVITWSVWQDYHQGASRYEQDWKTMVNNCGVLQVFGAMNADCAAHLADVIGCAPERLRCLNRSDAVITLDGGDAQLVRRPNYLTDPLFAGRFDANPFFAPAGTALVAARPRSAAPVGRAGTFKSSAPVDRLAARLLALAAPDPSKAAG